MTFLFVRPCSVALAAAQIVARDPDAYEVSVLAGMDAESPRDGVGEDARFVSAGPLRSDDANLWSGDKSALRRIDISTRQVTTITRLAGSGRYDRFQITDGLTGIWGDGTYIYVTDAIDRRVRRIHPTTALVEFFPDGVEFPRGIVGDGRYLWVGNSRQHSLKRIDTGSGDVAEFITFSGPIDPFLCGTTGSGSIGCFTPAPKSLWMDSGNVYATGFGTTLRIINTSTSEVSSSPVLPFIPDAITGNSGVLYYTEAKGQRIGKLVLATGETPVIFAGDPAWVFRSVWAIGDSLYVTASDRIIRLDLRTGLTEHFAGAEPLERRDGVGPAARFRSTGGVWSDGRSLFIVDGGIRRLDLATSEVTTLGVSLQAPKGVWGRLGRRRLPLCDRLEPGPPNPNQ